MAVGIMEMKYLGWAGRLRVSSHAVLAGLLVVSAILGALAAGLYTSDLQPWPYAVRGRHLVSDTITHDDELAMQRLIDYDLEREECWRQYDRRIVSLVTTGPRAGMVFRPDPVVDQKLPVDLSGRWQTWSVKLPEDFPCGPAHLIETVTAACTNWQRYVRHLSKPDIVTPFTVACPAAPG